MDNLKIATVSDESKKALKTLRFDKGKTITAIILKINKATLSVEVEETLEDTTIEDVINELPHQQPRYIVLSYPLKLNDGRNTIPFVLVYLSPQACSPELQMLYAGTKNELVNEGQFTKVIEYRNIEDFTEEEFKAKLMKIVF